MFRTVCALSMGLLLLLSLSCRAGLCEPTQGPPTSVVIIVIDTWRADRFLVGSNPARTAPQLAEWSQRGTVFNRAVAASPWTGPSVASIVTGRYPDELGIRDLDDPLPRSATTLAEMFQQADWETAAVVSNGYLSPWFGHDQGYDVFYVENYRGENDEPHPVFTADRITDKALEWIRSVEGSSFLYVHYTDPHDPYLPPEEYRERFAGPGRPLDEALLQDQAFARQPLTERQFREVKAMYDASVAFTDREIGRLLKQLPEEALIVITGDHGE
jgi:arylsulfatase A-like enzyme